MIEMLGVLAIIAVLSVGGIAGYSKAMLMWKSNLQKNMISELIASAIKLKPNLNHKSSTFDDITSVLYAMGDIPEGTSYQNNRIITKDKILVNVEYGLFKWSNDDGSTGTDFRYMISLSFFSVPGVKLNLAAQDFCRNVVSIAKDISEVKWVSVWVKDSESQSPNKLTGITLYQKTKDRAISLSEINNRCNMNVRESLRPTMLIGLEPY